MPSGWSTAAEIVSRVGRRLALISADVTDPFGSSDPNVLQLAALLSAVGEQLIRLHPWSHLVKTQTFSTVDGTGSYDTEADYLKTVDQTHWNRTGDRPLIGPGTPSEWQALKALDTQLTVSKVFRVMTDKVFIHPVPTAIEQFAFEYQSTWWVKETGQSAPNTEICDAATDTLYLDRHLMACALALAWKGEKEQNTAKAQNDFDLAWAAATGGDGTAPVLSVAGTNYTQVRQLGWRNLPDGGFGP